MFWLRQNRFCNLCIKGNVQIHLILFLPFGTRNTCKSCTINGTKNSTIPYNFYWKFEKESNLKIKFKEARAEPWVLLSRLFHSVCQSCLSNTFHCNNLDTQAKSLKEKKKKKINDKTALKTNNATFNPKGQLLSHTWHPLQYFLLFWSSFLGRDFTTTTAAQSHPAP